MALTSINANAGVIPFEMTKLDNGFSVAMSNVPEEKKCAAEKDKMEGKCGGN